MSVKHQRSQLDSETSLVHIVAVLGLLCAISGALITAFEARFQVWLQWNIIGHTIAGLALLLPLVIYTVIHFRRTVGIRKPSVLFSGFLASSLAIALLISGIWLAAIGSQENLAWVPSLHTITAYLVIAAAVWHVWAHWRNHANRAKKRDSLFITLTRPSLNRHITVGAVVYASFLLLVTLSYQLLYSTPENSVPSSYQSDYGPQPFTPSLTTTNNNKLVHLNQIAKSDQCGACHQAIFEDWRSSIHRHAASDPSYVKNITLLVDNKGIAAARYCEGCHAPVALLTGELTEGGQHGGIPETPAHIEGVGCMGCHGIDRIESTKGTASYRFDAKEHYLFDSTSSFVGQKIRNFLIQSSPMKHKRAMGGELISSPKLCASCHEQFMDKSMNDWGWVKMQSTYQEWLESPYSGQNDSIHNNAALVRCQDCHFAKTSGNDPSADHIGMVASHRSLGANTFVPIINGDNEQFELTKQFLQNSKLLVHIEKPTNNNQVTNDQFIDQALATSVEDNTPFFLYLGNTGEIAVTVTNRGVGHHFPAGTTDLNQAWLYLRVTDGNGSTVYESGALDENRYLDTSAHIYHSIPVDRKGKAVWRHDLFRMTGEVYKNTIAAGRSDLKTYQFKVPNWAKSPLTVEAVLKYRKLNQRYASWALENSDIEIPVIDMARDQLVIPLVSQQKASNSGD